MFRMCFGQVKRMSSNMSAASYDQLLRQVEVLKMENSNLRQELQDNSNHLTKLETEASNMKVSTPVSLSPIGDTAGCNTAAEIQYREIRRLFLYLAVE